MDHCYRDCGIYNGVIKLWIKKLKSQLMVLEELADYFLDRR